MNKYSYRIYIQFQGLTGPHHTFINMFKTKQSALKYFCKFWNSHNSDQFPNGFLSLEKTERGFSFDSERLIFLPLKHPFSIKVLTLDDLKMLVDIPIHSSFDQFEFDFGSFSSCLSSDSFLVSEVKNDFQA